MENSNNNTTVIRPVRVFKMGAVRLADPAPDMSPEEAIKLSPFKVPT